MKENPKITWEFAHAAGWDAGQRSMRAGDRTQWNQEDFNAAHAEMDRLLGEEKNETKIEGEKRC